MQISNEAKKKLKKRIFTSIEVLHRRKKRFKYASLAAASIVVLFCIGLYLNKTPTESISDFVKSSAKIDVNSSDQVTLILNNDKNVRLNEEVSAISYSSTGERVNIGEGRNVDQNTNNDEKSVYNTLLVPYGKRTQIQLSDGSKVWVNSGSRLVYPATFKNKKREVFLEGEAIFDVVHNADRPFKVLSEGHEIEVLGTVFNVSNYPDETSVYTVLKSGSVQINYAKDASGKHGKMLKIAPGTLAGLDKKSKNMVSEKVDVSRYFSWRDGILLFKNDDLRTIMRRLSRYYNVAISIDDLALANETFSGYLDLKDDVGKVIDIIQQTTDFKYNKESKTKITITN